MTDNKIYCVYIAPNEEMVRSMPGSADSPLITSSGSKTLIDPATSEGTPVPAART